MEMSKTELLELCQEIHGDSPRKSLLPILFAMNYVNKSGESYVPAASLCPEDKPDAYRVAVTSAIKDRFSFKQETLRGSIKRNLVKYSKSHERIGKSHPDHALINDIRTALNDYHANQDRVMLTPTTIMIYMRLVEGGFASSKELISCLDEQGLDCARESNKHLRMLEAVGLITLSRCSESGPVLGFDIKVVDRSVVDA